MNDVPEIVTILPTLVLAILMLFAYVGSIVWVARDAAARGKSPLLVALLVFFCWPAGLIVWLVLRPRTKALGEGPTKG